MRIILKMHTLPVCIFFKGKMSEMMDIKKPQIRKLICASAAIHFSELFFLIQKGHHIILHQVPHCIYPGR